MKIKNAELRFLFFFLPIFFLKLLNITASDKFLVVISIGCLFVASVYYLNQKIDKRVVGTYVILLGFTALLVLTCGKQGAFFSIIFIILLYNIEDRNNIYTICLIVGGIAVLVSCYIERNGVSVLRYNGNEWVRMYKRSNILYISFYALVNLAVYRFRDKLLRFKNIILLFIIGYIMYIYTGSRTGFFCFCILLVLLICSKSGKIFNRKIFKRGCIIMPAICMLFSVVTSYCYGEIPIVTEMDRLMQGRIAQSNMYVNNYSYRLLGQKIYESYSASDFCNLDNAYMDMLICYGLIFALLWICVSCGTITYLINNKRYLEAVSVVAYSIYGVSETFLPNSFLNVSLFLYADFVYSFFKTKDSGLVNQNGTTFSRD